MHAKKLRTLAGVFPALLLLFGTIFWLFGDARLHFTYQPAASTELTNEYYSQAEFQLAVAKYQTLVREADPSAAFIALREDSRSDNQLANACHAIAHMIGHAAYERFESFGEAMTYSEVACNNGYVHGLAEMHFTRLSDIETEVVATCAPYDVMTSLGTECRHGVGHGLALAFENDIATTIEHCDRYPTEHSRYACHTGAFMENFHTNELYHPSQFLDEEDPFRLCRDLDSEYHRACDRYAIHYYIRARQ